MQIDHPQVIDRTISMLLIDSAKAGMMVGSSMHFLVTNDTHNWDLFWRSAFTLMVVLHLSCFSYGVLQQASYKVSKFICWTKTMAVGMALLVCVSIYDDLLYIFTAQHDIFWVLISSIGFIT